MNLTAIATILATFSSPFFAVYATKWLEHRKEKQSQKEKIFHILMATRRNRLSVEHVTALNMIDIVFKKEKDVVKTWRELLYVFIHEYPKEKDYDFDDLNSSQDFRIKLSNANEKSEYVFINLLYEISKALKHDFDKEYLKISCYSPQGFSKDEELNQNIKKFMQEILSGKGYLNMNVIGFPEQHPNEIVIKALESQVKIISLLEKIDANTKEEIAS